MGGGGGFICCSMPLFTVFPLILHRGGQLLFSILVVYYGHMIQFVSENEWAIHTSVHIRATTHRRRFFIFLDVRNLMSFNRGSKMSDSELHCAARSVILRTVASPMRYLDYFFAV